MNISRERRAELGRLATMSRAELTRLFRKMYSLIFKKCRKCRKWVRVPSGFYLYGGAKIIFGYRKICKTCEKRATVAWQKAHWDRTLEIAREVRARDPEKYNAKARVYGARNRAAKTVLDRRWRDNNRERWREIKRASEAKRKALRLDCATGFTSEDLARLQATSRGCYYCGATRGKLTMDHVIPLSRGGAHARYNIVLACRLCNSQKHARTPKEWEAARQATLVG